VSIFGTKGAFFVQKRTFSRQQYVSRPFVCIYQTGEQALAAKEVKIATENAKFARKFKSPHTSQYTGVHLSQVCLLLYYSPA